MHQVLFVVLTQLVVGHYFILFYGDTNLVAAGTRDEHAEGTGASVDHEGEMSTNLLGVNSKSRQLH